MSASSLSPDSPPPDAVFVADGLTFVLDPDRGAIVISLSTPFRLGQSVTLNGRTFPIRTLKITSATGSLREIVVPSQVESIQCDSFANFRELQEVRFENESLLRELGGFEGCPLRSLIVPSSVEIITTHAFRRCESLRSVSFQEPSGLREIDGFAECFFPVFTVPASVSRIGPHAFAQAQMPLVIFESSTIIQILGFQHATLKVFRFPAPPTCSIAFFRVFVEYPTEILTASRRGALANSRTVSSPMRPHLALAVFPQFHDLPELWRAGCVDRTFDSSLFISLRIGDAPCSSGPRSTSGRSRYFRSVGLETRRRSHPPEARPTVAIEQVFAMLSFPHLECQAHTKRGRAGSFLFHVSCNLCDRNLQVLVKCPATALGLTVTTQGCCSHFFIGKGLAEDRRNGDMFITRPHAARRYDYPVKHPIRVMARDVLRSKELTPPYEMYLQSWMETSTKLSQGVAEPVRPTSLENVLASCPGEIRVFVQHQNRELTYEEKGVIALVWVAPWASDAISVAQFYELDCSFRALQPYVYSVPLAVAANVGIPLGIILGQSETAELYGMFAQVLSEQGMPRERFANLALLSDEGSAIVSYARSRGQRHFFCYRHILESLGSGTFVALLARRLIFTRTRLQFDNLTPQTMSDFAMGVQKQFISPAGAQKFAKVFGLHWPSGTGARPGQMVIPEIDHTFAAQALWGERGQLGVATCTNHVEGLHGRLNHATSDLRHPLRKLATVTDILKTSAGKWERKIRKSQQTALKKLSRESQKQKTRYDVCPFDSCDKGEIMSRRHAMVASCVHITWDASQTVQSSAPTGLRIDLSGHPRIEVFDYQGSWSDERRLQDVRDREGAPFDGDDEDPRSTEKVDGFLRQLRHELEYMQQGKAFRYSRDLMAHRLGRIQGRLEEQMRGVDPKLILRSARSEFLADCVSVIRNGTEWDE
jgi:hypothetical protein